MNNQIPIRLHNEKFRFFLIAGNMKTPIEKRWNTENCYPFWSEKLRFHILNGGNAGICTGYGSLIVIDFDDADYQKEKEKLLPKTFTVRTAGKGLKHFYYYLKGEMIKKIGIDIYQGVIKDGVFVKDLVRVCDIQTGRFGICCPPSKINRKFYSVIDDRTISQIDKDKLNEVFGINEFKEYKRRVFKNEIQPKKIQDTILFFRKIGIERTNHRHFKCPFHDMKGMGNLWIGDDASIHCFNCSRHWNSLEHFIIDWETLNKGAVID